MTSSLEVEAGFEVGEQTGCVGSHPSSARVAALEAGEIVEVRRERGVHDTVRLRSTCPQSVVVLEGAPVHLGADGGQNVGGGVGTGEAEHRVTCTEQLLEDCGHNETGRPGQKYALERTPIQLSRFVS